MKLKSFKRFLIILLAIISILPLKAEEKIDIWKNDKKNQNKSIKIEETNELKRKEGNKILKKNLLNNIQIEEGKLKLSDDVNVYGIHDPEDFNFDLNMWSTTRAEDVLSSIKRIKKINLSNTSKDILENVLLSFSYPPVNMSEEEFVELKINWLIDNKRSKLVESFLKQNKEFNGKSKAVQYLVDENISSGNIEKGCEKVEFIDSKIKAAYLEKFKIYCLAFNNKKNESRLLLDLLREQGQSDTFFDDKINYILGITKKTSQKIKEDNLLNFYLSSVTINNFKYEPTKKTKKEIWKYLSASNLIKLDDVGDKTKIKNLELAANQNQINKKTIFEIYKQIPFNLNTLVNSKSLYQTLNESDARALIYQRYLLSENVDQKLDYLFLLEELFIKGNIHNAFKEFLSDSLREIGIENIPENYQEVAKKRIKTNEELKLGKVKYNDKILHQSKILKFYVENESKKKVQKDLEKIFKKIGKNRKYFYSAKDLALVDTLIKDGFKIPQNFNYNNLASKYEVPSNLINLIEKKQNAFLALKIIEIIGEDEPHQLDPETIYFITSLLNDMGLIIIRNKVLNSALPLRV